MESKTKIIKYLECEGCEYPCPKIEQEAERVWSKILEYAKQREMYYDACDSPQRFMEERAGREEIYDLKKWIFTQCPAMKEGE